ncbi:MAG TPA: orotidine-5'-phosphate decarboxylase, partial [Clostridiaceae bacterium]|nr:orotidine-5'-phosphate decarboxylase [Clostridiaceae bacterium]
IKEKGCLAISDIKRGDIADTAKMYAKAHFEGDFETDFITLSPYMGMDSIDPYLKYIEEGRKGVFILVRTSNRGYYDFQEIKDENGTSLFYKVGDKVSELSNKYIGKCGYSSIGAVVGCTHREESKLIRERYKNMFFLIPGYGAQGGGGLDAASYLKDGNGGVVNSSRGILLAYKKYEDGSKNFDEYARKEVLRMREDIENAAGICRG